MVCRTCSGEVASASAGGKRRGGATFSGQRGSFRGPGAVQELGLGQRRLGASMPQRQGLKVRPKQEEKVARSSERWTGAPSGAPHPVLGLFPFDEIREGQRSFARDVRRAVARGERLVAHAPTGIGKTAAAVAPAVEEALDAGKKVLFLTSKQSQHRIVVDTLRTIVEARGGTFAAVDVISKRDMCPRPEKDEMPSFAFNDHCTRLCRTKQCSYFMENADIAIEETRAGIHHVEELVDISLTHGCCPHKVAMGAAKKADVVVCDYNYLFSDLRERILEAFDVGLSDLIVIVDEAHNLPDRVRSNFSLELSAFVLDEARLEARRAKDRRTERWCVALQQLLDRLFEGMGDEREIVLSKRELLEPLQSAIAGETIDEANVEVDGFVHGLGAVADDLAKAGDALARTGQLAEFMQSWIHGGPAYGRILRRDQTGGWRLVHTLLDPGVISGPILQDVHAAIIMSGTCHPPERYRDLLGLSERSTRVRMYPSPYDQANRPVVCVKGLTSKYNQRTPEMYRRMAKTIIDVHAAAPGNTAAFCLSYDFTARIDEEIRALAPNIEVLTETRAMRKADREQVLDALEGARPRGGALLLGVLGGSLSEGVDYKDNLLHAVSIVGLPLAPPGREVDLLIERYTQRFGRRGRDYAYVYPAMERVLQAAGRGIRGASDRCAVLLLDERFSWPMYARAFPDDFKPRLVEDPMDALAGFYRPISA